MNSLTTEKENRMIGTAYTEETLLTSGLYIV